MNRLTVVVIGAAFTGLFLVSFIVYMGRASVWGHSPNPLRAGGWDSGGAGTNGAGSSLRRWQLVQGWGHSLDVQAFR